jgi:MerR family transcriptional regulator, heat shock protein HspR
MKKGYYSIGVVSEMLGIHPQTIRYYEKEGLISPSRSPGKTRLYSDDDLQRLRIVHSLARDHGVNMAGIRIILQLKESCEDQIRQLESQQSEMVEYLMRLVKSRLDELSELNPASPVPVFSRTLVRQGRR